MSLIPSDSDFDSLDETGGDNSYDGAEFQQHLLNGPSCSDTYSRRLNRRLNRYPPSNSLNLRDSHCRNLRILSKKLQGAGHSEVGIRVTLTVNLFTLSAPNQCNVEQIAAIFLPGQHALSR